MHEWAHSARTLLLKNVQKCKEILFITILAAVETNCNSSPVTDCVVVSVAHHFLKTITLISAMFTNCLFFANSRRISVEYILL